MNGKPWTETDDRYLRRNYGNKPVSEISASLGRTVRAVQCRAQEAHGLTINKPFTAAEIRYLRRNYHRMTMPEIARKLGRTNTQYLLTLARKLGLPFKAPRLGEKRAPVICKLNAEGLSDTEIAERTGWQREIVSWWRRKLGLPRNDFNERHIERIRQATQEQCRRAGVGTLREIAVRVFRERAEAAGWPAELTPQEVAAMSTLWEHGPQTREQLNAAAGAKRAFNGGTVVQRLIMAGLVLRIRKAIPASGKGRNCDLYMIPLGVERTVTSGT